MIHLNNMGLFTPGHLMRFFPIGKLSDPEKTRCKCSPKRIRDGYKSDRSNHFRRWSVPHSRWNWTSVNASGCWNHICKFYSSQIITFLIYAGRCELDTVVIWSVMYTSHSVQWLFIHPVWDVWMYPKIEERITRCFRPSDTTNTVSNLGH